ncbi:unnamed protein product, partial [Bubo scandiacus]
LEKGLCLKAFVQKLDCNNKCKPGIPDPPFFGYHPTVFSGAEGMAFPPASKELPNAARILMSPGKLAWCPSLKRKGP